MPGMDNWYEIVIASNGKKWQNLKFYKKIYQTYHRDLQNVLIENEIIYFQLLSPTGYLRYTVQHIFNET